MFVFGGAMVGGAPRRPQISDAAVKHMQQLEEREAKLLRELEATRARIFREVKGVKGAQAPAASGVTAALARQRDDWGAVPVPLKQNYVAGKQRRKGRGKRRKQPNSKSAANIPSAYARRAAPSTADQAVRRPRLKSSSSLPLLPRGRRQFNHTSPARHSGGYHSSSRSVAGDSSSVTRDLAVPLFDVPPPVSMSTLDLSAIDAGDSQASAFHNQASVASLPVFALPSVEGELQRREAKRVAQEQAAAAAAAAAAAGAQDIDPRSGKPLTDERRAELQAERAMMKAELGLTDEQINEVMAAQAGAAQPQPQTLAERRMSVVSHSAGSTAGGGGGRGQDGSMLPPLPMPSPDAQQRRSSQAAAARQRRMITTRSTPRLLRGAGGYSSRSSSKRRRRGRGKRSKPMPTHGPALTAALRRELSTSITAVQQLTTAVKDDIAEVQRLCPITSIRAQLFMQKWGLKKFQAIFKRMTQSLLISAWGQWRWHIAEKQRAINADKVIRFKKIKTIERLIRNYEMGELAKGFDTWAGKLRAIKAAEQAVKEKAAAVVLQRAGRVFLAKMATWRLRRANDVFARNNAAQRIQRWLRSKDATKRAKMLTQRIREGEAATQIQRIGRGYVAKHTVARRREFLRREAAATRIQTMARGKLAKGRVQRVRQEKARHAGAVAMQKVVRGMLGRNKAAEVRHERDRERAAVKIQALARGRAARQVVHSKRSTKSNYMMRLNNAALKVQTRWRAHKGQLAYHLKRQAMKMRNRDERKAAVRIQAFWRGRSSGKSILERMRADNERRIHDARMYTEFWDDTHQCFYFYNDVTQESLWEPPESGYTKSDGRLVLSTGEVITDPRIRDQEDVKCVECNDALANRRCDNCDDPYCEECYERTHRGGKRALHTWRTIGSTKCMECEEEKATKWCEMCDDPYCDDCFQMIHRKGKKSAHEWHPMIEHGDYQKDQQLTQQEMATTGYDATYDAGYGEGYGSYDQSGYDQSGYDQSGYGYDQGGYDQTGYDQSGYDYGAADGGGGGDWVEYYDDVSGLPYWHNAASGETSWENPYG